MSGRPAIGRIVRSADFERVLGVAPRARSPHFAVHHLPAAPSRAARPAAHTLPTELSTESARESAPTVDDSPAEPSGRWLGAVVPKRHARRSVTRTLMKRQIRAAAAAESSLPPGLWVVRLRAPFPLSSFPSAASDALHDAVRDELLRLMAQAARAAPARARRDAGR